MPLINCEINLNLTWSSTCVITNSSSAERFAITDAKFNVHVVTLSIQDNAKLLQQLKSGFKRTINLNKYQSDQKSYGQNQYLNHLDLPVNDDTKLYVSIRKIATGQGDNYTTASFLDYPYFKENYKMNLIDLSKQQALDVDPRAIQQINFTANLDRVGNTTIFFIIEEAKETVLDFSQGTVKVL